ncbi:MAG TPA: hypothetical protein VF113_04545 [Stellaceae bacterium]
MRRPHRAAALLALCALGGCGTNAPLCRYWSDAPISRSVLDPSAVPMLPYNPYWDGRALSAAAASDPCAGQPGHPAVAVQ